MKKVAIILLINIYALSTFGFSLKQFYCCGKLQSVSVVLHESENTKCSHGANKGEDCCKTKFQHYKVKDNHIVTNFLNNTVINFFDLFSFPAYYQNILSFSRQAKVANSTHAPPLYNGVPAYISNCVYKI